METGSTLAPNGRYIAYESNEPGVSSPSGAFNVYVREITASGRPGPGKWQISSRRGLRPRWRPDGRELFFFDPPNLMAVDVRVDGPSFVAGQPRPLGISGVVNRYYVSRDGQRFLFPLPNAPSPTVHVLVNWLPLRDSASARP
jgi:hypothetical protein